MILASILFLAMLITLIVIRWQLHDSRECFEPQTQEELLKRFKLFKKGLNK